MPHTFLPSPPLVGRLRVPGDKSISHRALITATLATGESRITGLLEAEDTLATAEAMRVMGAVIEKRDGTWHVHGVGVGGLLQPEVALAMGNSGTSARLLAGLIASHGITACLTGDASLSRRPMERIITPLSLMGASFAPSPVDRLPMMVTGCDPAVPIRYRLPVPSAQVKSALLLAALNTPGESEIIEPVPTRDHTERMLRAMGAAVTVSEEGGERIIRVRGRTDLHAAAMDVPGDPSSAAFLVVAALLVEGSDVVIGNVCMNPTRTGLFAVLRLMGGWIEERDARHVGGEPVADLHVRHSALTGVEIDPALVPSMIDEFPVFFVAAACARGRTVATGLGELRVKESDRLAAMARALTLAGARVEETADGLVIDGTGGEPLPGTPDGTAVATLLDHRVAMSMAVAGLASRAGVCIDDAAPIATSFPDFVRTLEEAA
ncbi:3-phosphoshikimate 1-carboxyvinyltransferase [Erythrobacteraceae bacterium CFH 75059]|uniref:3-phosphoshikimate 1-carboxyvinyltransferase n=1 Tax=Qipengyuania thermophila TaxID=2509361 RepID=UPI0010214F87|nr:3-phosphoshikimate 1-carboxyvinyltransferase [Qipengyuania thermophila]TCD05389.1 3-phosphoshikimate 1-carboxyvinyltransferase [Erythrobacteraceae bacterium CFH 75059]